VVEYIVDDSWNNPLLPWISHNSFHRMSLSGGRLSIGKDSSVVPAQNICNTSVTSFLLVFH
jgi:hypothetical protein